MSACWDKPMHSVAISSHSWDQPHHQKDILGKYMLISRPGLHPQISVCQTPQLVLLCQALKSLLQSHKCLWTMEGLLWRCHFPQQSFVGWIYSSHILCFHLHGWRSPAVKAVPGAGKEAAFQELTGTGTKNSPWKVYTVLRTDCFTDALRLEDIRHLFLSLSFFFSFFSSPLWVKSQAFECRLFLPGSLPCNFWISPQLCLPKHHFLLLIKVPVLFGEKASLKWNSTVNCNCHGSFKKS